MIYLPLIVALIGLLIYALVNESKLQEIGRIAFFAGLLAYLVK